MSTRPDPPADRDSLLAELAVAGRLASDATVLFHTALAEKLGLRTSDWKALNLLEHFGPLTHGELSHFSGLAPASITGVIDRLEAGGWVHRQRDPDDGRRVVVELDSAVTQETFADYYDGLTKRMANVYAHYTLEELQSVRKYLHDITRCQKEATAELTQRKPA